MASTLARMRLFGALGALTGVVLAGLVTDQLPGRATAVGAPPVRQAGTADWIAIKWPFLRDAWGEGLAYECTSADCPRPLRLFVRVKVGFCDCARGVADDDEVDRVGDVDLLGRDFTAADAGRAIAINDIRARARGYRVKTSGGDEHVLAIAYAANCNVAVATVVGDEALADHAAAVALDLVRRRTVMDWVGERLGL